MEKKQISSAQQMKGVALLLEPGNLADTTEVYRLQISVREKLENPGAAFIGLHI